MSLIVKMSGPSCFSTQAEYNILDTIVKQQTVVNTIEWLAGCFVIVSYFKG